MILVSYKYNLKFWNTETNAFLVNFVLNSCQLSIQHIWICSDCNPTGLFSSSDGSNATIHMEDSAFGWFYNDIFLFGG